MNKIKTVFSIKDLENLSGIKAHTIRIWEKRYTLFTPDRNPTNIRSYNLEDLQKLLNIAFLLEQNYKISKVANLSFLELSQLVQNVYSAKNDATYAIKILKVAMLNFDEPLFNSIYNELLQHKSFSDVFEQVFLPFLFEIGLLWQTTTIKSAHEHFISALMYKKLMSNVAQFEVDDALVPKPVDFILFLPEDELHEIMLLYFNYVLLDKGFRTLYLGASTPLEDLEFVHKNFPKASFVSYFTIAPAKEKLAEYLESFTSKIVGHNPIKLHVSGKQVQNFDSTNPHIVSYPDYKILLKSI